MKCYIKSSKTFATLAQRDTEDYALTLDSLNGEKSSVTILGEDSPVFLTGNFLILNGDLYLINTVAPSKGKTKLGLLPPDAFFNRVLLYQTGASSIGAFIANVITSEWINQTDAAYRTPYITLNNINTTTFVAPETDDDGTYNLLDYIRMVRAAYGVKLTFTFTGDALTIGIWRDGPSVRPLVDGDGHTQLISSDFKASVLSKLTVYKSVDTGEKDADNNTIYETQTSVWYLAADGTVSSTVPQSRADGGWGSINIGNDDDPEEKAAEEFSKNESSRKIELFTDKTMRVGDRARIRINGEIVESTVTAIYRSKKDQRTRYKLGDMITTMTEKVDALGGSATKIIVASGSGVSFPAWLGGSY